MRLMALAAVVPAAALLAVNATAQWTMPAGSATATPAPPPTASCPPVAGQPPPPGGCPTGAAAGTTTAPPAAPPVGAANSYGAQPTPPAAAPPATPPPSAGGLTAPPPMAPAAQRPGNDTQAQLDQAEEDDSGRGLSWFYLEAEGGFEHVGLETFAVDQSNLTAGMVPSTASGGFVGAGVGIQLLFITLGPRFRAGFFENWEMFSIGGELGFRIPVGFLEPHIELGGGYQALGSLGGALASNADAINISGPYGRISGGLDFFIGHVFTIGPAASWEFMALTRPGIDPTNIQSSAAANCDATNAQQAQECALAAEGSGWGSAVTIGGKLGLHF